MQAARQPHRVSPAVQAVQCRHAEAGQAGYLLLAPRGLFWSSTEVHQGKGCIRQAEANCGCRAIVAAWRILGSFGGGMLLAVHLPTALLHQQLQAALHIQLGLCLHLLQSFLAGG